MNQTVEQPESLVAGDEIDLRDLWETFSPWKWRILLLSVLVALLALVVASSMTPLYPAATTLMVEAGSIKAVKIEQVYDVESPGNEYFETQFAVVRSREIARRVVVELELVKDRFFFDDQPGLRSVLVGLLPLPEEEKPQLSDDEKIDAATAALMEKLRVEPVRKTQLVTISIEHPDQKVAARITDAVARHYIENQLEVQLDVTRSAAEWLGSRLSGLKRKLEEAESELQQFLQANNLVDLQGVQTVPAEELKELNKQVAEARGKVNEASRRYGDRHPLLVAVREELVAVEREYAAKLRELQNISRKETRLRQLQRNVQVSRYLYDTFLQRVSETAETGKWEAPGARIVDRGVAAMQPSKPRKRLIAAVAFMLSFLFATAGVFVAAAFDRGVKTPQQLREIGIAPLGALPLLPPDKYATNPYQVTTSLTDHAFTEAVKTLRTNIILDDVLQKRTAIAVSSIVPGEGKTTVALCLARSLAELERVLVIDADLRRPSVHRALGLPSGGVGLAQLIAGVNNLEECVVPIGDNLHVIPAGAVPPNPSELLSSPMFARLLADARVNYDRVIIDTAPVGAVSDGLVVGAQVDGVICVIHADRTEIDMLSDSVRRLQERGSKIIGGVLNKVTEDLLRRHQYYYYGYYGRYEGYTTPSRKA